MCGIAGFVGDGGRQDIERMTEALVHRGPDGSGVFIDPSEPIHLGHRRLAVVDLESGAQPMHSADGLRTIVFNGEIYNHRELRDQLEDRGHVFRSDHSDTEVLLHGYVEWGDALESHLNGMWAFALVDRATRRLILSRDRFGQKPLYYTQQAGILAFASELTALARHSKISTEPCARALRKYFAYGFVPSPLSLFEQTSKLPAGSRLTASLDSKTSRVHKYWELTLDAEENLSDVEEERIAEKLREVLGRAVQRRMMADVPVGVFLSGGIDSSLIAALAAETKPHAPLRSYSIAFDDPSFDESAYAARAASLIGSEHHCTTLSIDAARGLLPELIGKLDEPMADGSLLATSLLCREARADVTVALGGDGADELFAGYDPFRALRLAERYARSVPRPIHRAVSLVASKLPASHRNMSFDFKIKRTLSGLDYPAHLWNPVWMAPLPPAQLSDFLSEPVDPEDIYSEAIDAWEASRSNSLVDRTTLFFVRLYLQDGILTKVDRASMLHSLEVRSPFLDIELVDLVRRIPATSRLRGGTTKHILKRAAEPILPPEIIHRAKKGFGIPIGRWFRDGQLAVDAQGPLAGLIPGSDRYISATLALHRSGRADHRLSLYAHWIMNQWLHTRARPTPPPTLQGVR